MLPAEVREQFVGTPVAGAWEPVFPLLVTGVERDTLGIPLRPMTFLADAALAATERWDDNAVLFARLAPAEETQP
jgi:hypothetical protein